MSRVEVSPDVRRWIIDQATAGHLPEVVLQAMIAAGWSKDVAIQALEDTMRDFLVGRLPAREQLPPAVPVPEPLPAGWPNVIQTPDREVRVLLSLRDPRVVVFGGLLSDDECEGLIELADPRLKRSTVVQLETGGHQLHDARTSDGMFFKCGENELVRRLEARIASLMRWPLENGEGIQVLHYGPGAEYKPHYDYFDPAHSGTASILKRGGQRVATLVCYLNTPISGGATVFPDVQLEVAAVRGNAVFFSYERPHPSTKTLHGGAPVVEGEKWVATKWVRESRFDGW
jgi:prolyl 4-hydroxylase